MEYRWVQESVAKKLIADSDSRRQQFLRELFRRRLVQPLEYDLTVNSGRLGPTAIETWWRWPPSVTGAATT